MTSLEHKERLQATFRLARAQPRGQESAEQRQFYEWIDEIYHRAGLPKAVFARQVGVTPKMVEIWLARRGHFPAGARLEALFALWEANHD